MHPLQRIRESYGLSVNDLSVLSDVAVSTIRGIENGTKIYKTNDKVAELLAEALDVGVSDIFEQCDLSHRGRPGGTGKPIGARTESLLLIRPHETFCENCRLAYPRQAECPGCFRVCA